MRPPRAWTACRLLMALALLAIAGLGCGRKSATTVLLPTGFRPSPAVPTGAIYGYVFYDSVGSAGIQTPPYPPTIVQLEVGGAVTQRDTLATDSTRFHFEGVAAGTYTIRAVTGAFLPGIASAVFVADHRVDAGNVHLSLPGSLFGFVVYDPQNAPDLGVPPFPHTVVQLSLGGVPVVADTLSPDSTRFHFEHLAPGNYSLQVTAMSFSPTVKSGLAVAIQQTTAVGVIPIFLDNSLFTTVECYLLGDIPGFGIDQEATYESGLDENLLGVRTYPNSVYPTGTAIPAGTYRFKLITDTSSTPGNLIGWGWSPSDVLQVPFTNHAVVRGTGPATDIVANFPLTAVYDIRLDERFHTLTIVPAPSASAARLMRNRP